LTCRITRPGPPSVWPSTERRGARQHDRATDSRADGPPREITLEFALKFINDDELIEVTPDAIRLRRRQLDPGARKKAMRQAAVLAREA